MADRGSADKVAGFLIDFLHESRFHFHMRLLLVHVGSVRQTVSTAAHDLQVLMSRRIWSYLCMLAMSSWYHVAKESSLLLTSLNFERSMRFTRERLPYSSHGSCDASLSAMWRDSGGAGAGCASSGRKQYTSHSQNFSQWRVDALSIPHYVIKKGRPHGARYGKTDAQKEHFVVHNARKRCIKKRILKEFTIVSNEIQYIVIRNSNLAGLRRSASQWINWHRKTTPTAHPLRNMRHRKTGTSH